MTNPIKEKPSTGLEPIVAELADPSLIKDIQQVLQSYSLVPFDYTERLGVKLQHTDDADGKRFAVLTKDTIGIREIRGVSLPVILVGPKDIVHGAGVRSPGLRSSFTNVVEFPLPNGVTERFSWREDQAGEPFIVVYQTAEDISTDEKALAYTERVPDNFRFDIYHPRFKGEPQCQATKDDSHGNEVKFVILCPGCALQGKREAARNQPDKEELIRCLYVGWWR